MGPDIGVNKNNNLETKNLYSRDQMIPQMTFSITSIVSDAVAAIKAESGWGII
jgi:hypothetical protein